MHAYSFEKLDVWQRGRELNKLVYHLSRQLPNDEKFGITSQVRRATISVSCNLAEGSARANGKEQARFSKIAYGSLMEVMNLLITSADLNYIQQSEVDHLRPLVEELSRKINALRLSQHLNPSTFSKLMLQHIRQHRPPGRPVVAHVATPDIKVVTDAF